MGCTIWLEGETARTTKHASTRLLKWFIDHIGDNLFVKETKNAPTGNLGSETFDPKS